MIQSHRRIKNAFPLKQASLLIRPLVRMNYYWERYHARKSNIIYEGPVGISDAEADFLTSSLHKYPNKLARFRLTVKAHKIKDNRNEFTMVR